jgi:hypothetical protein
MSPCSLLVQLRRLKPALEPEFDCFFLFSLPSLSFLPLMSPSLGVFSYDGTFTSLFLLLGFRRALCFLGLFISVVLFSVRNFFSLSNLPLCWHEQ